MTLPSVGDSDAFERGRIRANALVAAMLIIPSDIRTPYERDDYIAGARSQAHAMLTTAAGRPVYAMQPRTLKLEDCRLGAAGAVRNGGGLLLRAIPWGLLLQIVGRAILWFIEQQKKGQPVAETFIEAAKADGLAHSYLAEPPK